MLDKTEVLEQVREVMSNVFGVAEDDLPEDVSQENFPRWDSLYHMTLLVSLEDSFNLIFSMNERTTMTSQKRILEVLETHLAEAGV